MKRALAISFCLLLVLPVLAFPVFASEVYTFRVDPDNSFGEYMLVCNESVPSGMYTITYYRNGTAFVSKDPVNVQFMPDELDGHAIDIFYGEVVLSSFPLEETRPVVIANIDGKTLYEVDESPGYLVIEMRAVSSGVSSLPTVSDTLSTCISWVGTVTTSLLSGELNPLLLIAAIPIAISVVLLTVKVIKKNSWGV